MKNPNEETSPESRVQGWELSSIEALAVSDAFEEIDEPARPAPAIERVTAGRARLLTVATTGIQRYAPFFGRIGPLFDLPVHRVEEELARAELASEWHPGPLPQISLFHLTGGPKVAAADTGFVRIDAGFHFPMHAHTQDERALLLRGSYVDETGRVYRAGDLHEMNAGSRHSLQIGEEPVLLALVLWGPIEIG